MAVAIESRTTALFRPTNRLQDLLREWYGNDSYELPPALTEVEILPHLSLEHILATGITWEDFCRCLDDDKFIWMGPGVYVCDGYPGHRPPGYGCIVGLGSLNGQAAPTSLLYVNAARVPESAAAACDFLVRLLATSKNNDTFICGGQGSSSLPISGPTLSHFFQESQANLRKFTLESMLLNAEHQIRALATESQLDMEVILKHCTLLSADPDCHAAFIECLHRDRGLIQLNGCQIDCQVLAAALEDNSRVTRLGLAPGRATATSDAKKGVIFRSLAENKGLVELDLNNRSISDKNWTILCQSLLKGHPTLTILDLRGTGPRAQHGFRMVMPPNKHKAQRTHVLVAMVEANQVLHSICLCCQGERDERIYVESILPHLKMNLYRTRVLGIKKVEIALHRPLLGLALQTPE
jgi:hypothetical protein